MFLVQILLPISAETKHGFANERYDSVITELTERFGGVTAFTRTPAEGRWKPEGEAATQDDIVVVEVMVDRLDRDWWRQYRNELEHAFKQECIVVRAQDILLL